MLKELLNRALKHISSLSLLFLTLVFYVAGNPLWLSSYLPDNSKPLLIFLLISLAAVYEMAAFGHKHTAVKLTNLGNSVETILHQMEVNRLIQSVNGMYGRFVNSGDEWIDNDYSIKELSELKDMRDRLDVNSYTQGRLEYLCSKIKR